VRDGKVSLPPGSGDYRSLGGLYVGEETPKCHQFSFFVSGVAEDEENRLEGASGGSRTEIETSWPIRSEHDRSGGEGVPTISSSGQAGTGDSISQAYTRSL